MIPGTFSSSSDDTSAADESADSSDDISADDATNNTWNPIFARLKKLDPALVIPDHFSDDFDWQESFFVTNFERILKQLHKETTYFLRDKRLCHYPPPFDEFERELEALQYRLKYSKDINLGDLEDVDKYLNILNAERIKKQVDFSSSTLDISHQNLTRFPNPLFDDPAFANHCKKLTHLKCSHNRLRALPEFNDFNALTHLDCCNNKLVDLPDSIGHWTGLEYLACSSNKLKGLPPSIGNCILLKILYCGNNEIEKLPVELGNCLSLQSLVCGYNKLLDIPASLGRCPLIIFSCAQNYIDSIFGNFNENWVANTLANQRSRSYLPTYRFHHISLATTKAPHNPFYRPPSPR